MESLKVDDGSQRLLLEAVKEYAESLRLNQKHVFLCLPRLLTLWFDFTALVGSSTLRSNQDRANDLLKDCIKTIPAISYYTVLPQLVSRLNHSDEVTSAIVSAILRRVLTKFPKQAMWGLAWLRNSVHPERQVKGEEIFKGAQKNMQRCENDKTHDLLAASKGLFVFLIQLAKYQPKKQDSRYINVRSWKGEVSLEEFLPPVQAALTITRNAIGGSSEKEVESFPPFVPRMRSFSTQVQVMSSKAKPKKLTAFAVPRGRPPPENTLIGGGNTCTKTQPGDIGEMHFLVKQEAKGDLRKDARVQDFNNVVNRLLATSSIRNSSNRRKRRLGDLRLKTFSVVCLSEDCGIIEWVPNTDSLRNIVSEAYNPQAPAESIKRRGKRIANFGDPNLRDSFQKCQDLYIKNGDLSGAVKLFDELCIKEYPPLLYWWFVHKFEDPHKWFEARSLFTLSSAVWSAVGHVIGLGDRHSENLLIDVSSGECVHVDFDWYVFI
jgi:serine/threonine-protein kinase ATR